MELYIIDAFTEHLFGGNPAGVVLLDDAPFPAEETMMKTAAELRYSETAFVRRTGPGGFHTRYFTPTNEVDLCGHATIASFFALAQSGRIGAGCYQNQTLAGLLAIEVDEKNTVLMEMGAPQLMGDMRGETELAALYAVMGLGRTEAVQMEHAGMPKTLWPQLVSTGLPDIIMPVADEKELAAIQPDFAALTGLSRRYEVVGVHAFCPPGADGAVHCRNFAPLYGIDEEAATGTSNGALTYYLYHNGLIKTGSVTRFIQGEAMGRPSRITSRITAEAEQADIRVGGSAVALARGEIFI